MRGLVPLALAATISVARADDRPADDRIGLVVRGTAGLRGRLEDHLAKKLRREGLTTVDKAMSRDATETLGNCFLMEDLVCARGVVEARAKTPRVLFVQVDEDGGTITIDLTWFSLGSAPIAEHVTCESCADTYREQVDPALQRLVSSAPVPVVPAPEPDVSPPPPASRALPLALVAGGTLTAAAGGVCLYYGLRDGASHKYIYPQLTPVGITLLALGAGAAITGAFLWPTGSNHSHPVAAVSGSGAYVGWAGAF